MVKISWSESLIRTGLRDKVTKKKTNAGKHKDRKKTMKPQEKMYYHNNALCGGLKGEGVEDSCPCWHIHNLWAGESFPTQFSLHFPVSVCLIVL